MPRRQVDPARLSGEQLKNWYERSPQEIELERLATENDRLTGFMAGGQQDLATTNMAEPSAPSRSRSRDDEVLWMADGRGEYRAINSRDDAFQRALEPDPGRVLPAGLPANPAAMEAGEFDLVGNPHTPRLRREWEIEKGLPWPRTETGRNYDVSHRRAIADGGTNTLDNIEPMHPDLHAETHAANGDHARWGKRPSIARAFGGTVMRGLGPLSVLSNITGILSGRIRMDSFDNFSSDMLGLPSQADQRRAFEERQKLINPKWKPGDPFII